MAMSGVTPSLGADTATTGLTVDAAVTGNAAATGRWPVIAVGASVAGAPMGDFFDKLSK